MFASFGKAHRVDASLSMLLITQVLMTFVAIPLSASYPEGRTLLDIGRLVFAGVCALTLTKRPGVRIALLGSLLILAAGPFLWDQVRSGLGLGKEATHEVISCISFVFSVLVSILVSRRTFGPGRVTAHRVQGAILVYLNVASLFAIAYSILETHAPGSLRLTSGGYLSTTPGARSAELSYFSLATITTTGYGDIVPVHPFTRSLANLEGVFGQLFPATVLARLVSLYIAHGNHDSRNTPAKGAEQSAPHD